MTLPAFLRRFCLVAVSACAGWAAPLAAQTPQGKGTATPGIPAYLGSESCAECHAEETEAWAGSHHAKAWLPPTPGNVLGDFDNATFTQGGLTARFYREDGAYMVEVSEPDGSTARYPVHSAAGIAPLQQYLLETEPGRLQSFDVAWDVERERWYHLYPDTDLAPTDGLHWSGPYKNWNARCAECHATGFEKNYDPANRRYQSTQAEIGVGCEACHGPGQAHVEWARLGVINRAFADSTDDAGFTITFSADDPYTEREQCAGCHSRREAFGDGNPLPGTAFDDAYRLALLRPGLYHDDGSILEEVYVYGSFLQSKMAAKGVRCSNCHEVHSGTLKAEGNATCTQCHSPAGNPDFPSLPLADYDTPDHHFHPEGTEGAQCKSCHMIERTYMGIDGRRDHSFRVPRPDLAAATNAPDACTDCHTDQTAAWAAAELETRFPDSRHRGPHFATTFANARANPARQVNALARIALAEDQPAIIRASAMELLRGAESPEAAAALAGLIDDPDPLVRAAAVGLQRFAPDIDKVQRLLPALKDETRLVRLAAVLDLFAAPIARLPQASAQAFSAAAAEWREVMALRADFPEGHLVMGGAALTMRNIPVATEAFGEAVRLDPQLVQAWSMLARIKAAVGDLDGARQTIAEGLAANPSDPLLLQTVDQF
ncbi:Doubled CXXCH motif (Paired_CXXCH_1) [Pseudoruegeria aquimaris]|uniref:Doubled CXXCH motif (Paired_CXXCH_1) n=1 Tax=Pseudoruegeria aquimaris TaxID=393663 RepID=A0A1Y5SDN8_9RHOB|nr:multiheme c-type cytochrome [Pseudoruegeria aquimaris]SLN37639.1 Doubled CXXCH motif (Paired_CXXCH_1) [Pseudoruegeria aquimaris]